MVLCRLLSRAHRAQRAFRKLALKRQDKGDKCKPGAAPYRASYISGACIRIPLWPGDRNSNVGLYAFLLKRPHNSQSDKDLTLVTS
ncbi:hypothetical protein RRG08_032226 [Elysia crispata]|uniref:Uncharacterized protein n=1 Tax=Elysia crispata TaxID=231223 RepID=A0AAE1E7C1_9GAST|nr:hypothetical protein RRG08_032226 [Elysia crispata]